MLNYQRVYRTSEVGLDCKPIYRWQHMTNDQMINGISYTFLGYFPGASFCFSDMWKSIIWLLQGRGTSEGTHVGGLWINRSGSRS